MNEISFSNWQTFAIIIFNETKFQKKKKKKKKNSILFHPDDSNERNLWKGRR